MTETANNFLFQRYTPRAYWLRREKERRTRKDPPDPMAIIWPKRLIQQKRLARRRQDDSAPIHFAAARQCSDKNRWPAVPVEHAPL